MDAKQRGRLLFEFTARNPSDGCYAWDWPLIFGLSAEEAGFLIAKLPTLEPVEFVFLSKQGSKELFRKIMSEKVKMPTGSMAAACKLLKGILNRITDARLGVTRSTMFEVGWVARLKQAAFFAKIDWTKLEQRELEPPCILMVDNKHNLRHFHNEFTSMPLPRSVNFISSLDDPPRRFNSNTFRGFSFIQPHFSLPERNITNIEVYWHSHPEEEGESDSDVASSKCGGKAVLPLEPGKKKRPPRQRKKKSKDAETASTATSLASEEGGKPKKTSRTRVWLLLSLSSLIVPLF